MLSMQESLIGSAHTIDNKLSLSLEYSLELGKKQSEALTNQVRPLALVVRD
jgi:hypothetical protein